MKSVNETSYAEHRKNGFSSKVFQTIVIFGLELKNASSRSKV